MVGNLSVQVYILPIAGSDGIHLTPKWHSSGVIQEVMQLRLYIILYVHKKLVVWFHIHGHTVTDGQV